VSATAAQDWFARTWGGAPEVIASAPARVNLIGEHTDYNGGDVLPVAIDRRVYVAGRRSSRATVRAASSAEPRTGEFSPCDAVRTGEWWDYVAGVAIELSRSGVAVPPADLAIWGEIPAGAGLSSSAALEIATGLALASLAGATIELPALALLAHRAESSFVGVAVGIMDQFASALAKEGHALYLQCATPRYEHVPFTEGVLVFDTCVPRALRGSAFNARRSECEQALTLLRGRFPTLARLADATPEQVREAALPPPLDRRARHVATEMERVRRFVERLRAGQGPDGELLLASHESLRADYECSAPELDWFVEQAVGSSGVRGARLTGAGWGGCAIAVGDAEALIDAGARLAAEYERVFHRTPRYWVSSASPGARRERAASASAHPARSGGGGASQS
jgi:galactokinase